ncbi:FMN-linked oxidoreductase [Sistotremastrum suecicum HHB10207 ss-3]|uniref:FMN-linked oxidoreductase n=1 Tax=Sistotremastrum suecicum HHB10207 ss-3 TaxID=1314776 RepID=A0A166IGA8_9AGAM|nr:FMN-linked oxidoreductase [Sistotremastrum suecicum HHB10207 ss-3]
MDRRSVSPSDRPAKRLKPETDIAVPTIQYRNAVILAPMVRSGSLPTRLTALKHGASLVWSPEIVDKAILHTERNVDPKTGVVSYDGKTKAVFSTHPIEKPYLIYQIGSADPTLAVQAAKTVMQDVSAFDLNCGCPKPFSTHAGMGAALLTNPDLLCSILKALREALPPEYPVTAKIRLLPDQTETLNLVSRILETGVSAITVHCRTRAMRREKALIERLKEIVEFVERTRPEVAVIENGDCLSVEDSLRVKRITAGAHSVMIATAAESNPSCFSKTPLVDVETTLIPSYIRLARYVGNAWANTKFCVSQFQSPSPSHGKVGRKQLKALISSAKSYDDLTEVVGDWNGEEDFAHVTSAIETRTAGDSQTTDDIDVGPTRTPPEPRPNPVPEALKTPLSPVSMKLLTLSSIASGRDSATPTPSRPVKLAA